MAPSNDQAASRQLKTHSHIRRHLIFMCSFLHFLQRWNFLSLIDRRAFLQKEKNISQIATEKPLKPNKNISMVECCQELILMDAVHGVWLMVLLISLPFKNPISSISAVCPISPLSLPFMSRRDDNNDNCVWKMFSAFGGCYCIWHSLPFIAYEQYATTSSVSKTSLM